MALTVKQQAFVEAYCGNATEAALQAGYSPKTAAFIGAENLKKPKINVAIKEREDKRLSPLIAKREERQEFWTSMMRDKTRKDDIRLKASELLAKSEGDFLDRAELSGPNGSPLNPPQLVVNFVKANNDPD